MAATQGVYNRVNTRNTKAENGAKIVCKDVAFPPSSTVNVLTTLSFAVNPVINAVEILQSLKPSGLNNGAIHPPSNARRLF